MDFDLFGGLFDFHGDGETNLAEALMGVHILSEMEEEEHGKSRRNLQMRRRRGEEGLAVE